MSLLSLLTGSLSSQSSVDSLAKKTGLSSAAAKAIVAAAVPILIKSLTKNASSKEGASSLLGALMNHKNTKPIAQQIDEADVDDGGKIVNHIFGNNKTDVLSQLASQTGMDSNQVASALSSIAPALLSSLSAVTTAESQQAQVQQIQPQQPAGGLGGLLGGLLGGGSNNAQPQTNAQQQANPMSALTGIFGDQLGDMAGSLLGGANNAQQSAGGIGNLLGGLLGGGADKDDDKDNDGGALLSSLLGGLF